MATRGADRTTLIPIACTVIHVIDRQQQWLIKYQLNGPAPVGTMLSLSGGLRSLSRKQEAAANRIRESVWLGVFVPRVCQSDEDAARNCENRGKMREHPRFSENPLRLWRIVFPTTASNKENQMQFTKFFFSLVFEISRLRTDCYNRLYTECLKTNGTKE